MNKVTYIFFVLLSSIVYSQSPNEQINEFFKTYKTNKEGAIRNLMTKNPVNKVPELNIKQLVDEINKLDKHMIGDFKGYELISEKHISNTIISNSYVVKHEHHPIRFTFTFYKAEDEWKIFHFNFDTKLLEELLEASKLYYQNLNPL